MRTTNWVKSFLSGLGLFGPRRRTSVWQKTSRQTQELQALEARTLMSAISVDADPHSYLPPDAALLPYGDPTVSPPLFGPPVHLPGSGSFVPNEDLYDEGAGAVWGGLMDLSPSGRDSLSQPPYVLSPLGGGLDDGDDDPGNDIGGNTFEGNGFCGVSTGGYGGGDATGGGSTGGGYGGGSSGNETPVTVDLDVLKKEILEGPYTSSQKDRTKLIVHSLSPLWKSKPTVARLHIRGHATPDADYRMMDGPNSLFPNKIDDDEYYYDVVIMPGTTKTELEMITQLDTQWEYREDLSLKLIEHPNGSTKPVARDYKVVSIIDATADLEISTIGNNSRMLPPWIEDTVGGHIRVNNDFDNGTETPDNRWYYQQGSNIDALENDWMPLTVTSHLQSGHDYAGKEQSAWFTLDYDPTQVRLWKRPNIDSKETWVPYTLGSKIYIPNGQTWHLAVEGLRPESDTIALNWHAKEMPRPRMTFDLVTANVWDVDLDIDSDNNNALLDPGRTEWEEYLENHLYGIGKLIMEPAGDPPPGLDIRDRFVPVPFTIQPADVMERAVKFDFKRQSARSGQAEFWTQHFTVPGGLIHKPVEEGGHLLTPGRVYTFEELGNIDKIWIEPIMAQRGHNTLEGAKRYSPIDFLNMTGYVREKGSTGDWTQIVVDDVKYKLNQTNDVLYPNLQFDRANRYWDTENRLTGEVLRDALVSEAVYSVSDLQRFGLKKITEQEMTRLGLSFDLIQRLKAAGNPSSSGLKSALYRDFLSPEGKGYILAFAGTEMSYDDFVEDVVQGLGMNGDDWVKYTGHLKQYEPAMALGRDVSEALTSSGLQVRMTGHSLGGGLASAASIAANEFSVSANTFNAAGLHRNTICFRDDNGNLHPDVPAYPNAFRQYNLEISGVGRINAYHVSYDILTLIQTHLPPIPEIGRIPTAIGKQLRLYGPLYQSMNKLRDEILRSMDTISPPGIPNRMEWLRRFSDWAGRTSALYAIFFKNAARLHKMESVIYALMVQRDISGGEYESRDFDIFGYKVDED